MKKKQINKKKIQNEKKIITSLLLLTLALIITFLMIPSTVPPANTTATANISVTINSTSQTHSQTLTHTNTTHNTTNITASTGAVQTKNQTEQNVIKNNEENVQLILNPYEKYAPPVKLHNWNGHQVFAVEYFDTTSKPCAMMQKTLTTLLGNQSVWVRIVNNDYDNQVRLDYITRILYGRYYSYYVVPISAIFIDDKLAIVLTGYWDAKSVKEFINWYINNQFVAPGRFMFIDIMQAENDGGTVYAKLINSNIKYDALIDLFLQKGKYKYSRLHVLAEYPTS